MSETIIDSDLHYSSLTQQSLRCQELTMAKIKSFFFVWLHLFVSSIIKIQLKKTTQSLEMTKRESEQKGKQTTSFNHDWLTKWKKNQVPLILIDDIKSLLMWWVSPNYKMPTKFDYLFYQIKSLWQFFSRTLFFSFLMDRPDINCMMFLANFDYEHFFWTRLKKCFFFALLALFQMGIELIL